MTELGCIGHWYGQLPIAVMGGAVAHQRVRKHRHDRVRRSREATT